MNLKNTFEALFGKAETGIATITGDKGGSYAATTQSGAAVTLTGTAEIGWRVFYDRRSGRITGRAPDLAVTEIPL